MRWSATIDGILVSDADSVNVCLWSEGISIEELLPGRLGLDAVDRVRVLSADSDSRLTNVYMEVAEELRRSALGRCRCSADDVGLMVDILRSPVMGLISITSRMVSLSILLPRLTRADEGR